MSILSILSILQSYMSMSHLQLLLGVLDLGRKLAENVAALDQVINLLGGKTALAEKTLQPLRLLLYVSSVGSNLAKHLDVVSGISLSECGGDLGSLLGNGIEALATGEFGYNGVKGSDGSGSGIEATTNRTVSAGLFVDVLDESLLGAGTLVSNSLLGALGEELDGWVRLDSLILSSGLCVGCLGVNLGDENIWFGGKIVGERLPDGSERLAV